MHFLKIISADIVFKFYRYTHIRIVVLTGRGDWEWGAMTFKGASKEARRSHTPLPPKRSKMAQNQHVPRYSKKKKTKQQEIKETWLREMGLYYLLSRKQAKSDSFSEMVHLSEVRPLPNPSFRIRH